MDDGKVREWLNRHAWKACVAERLPRVQIPPLPHACRPAGDQPEVEKACMVARSSRVRIPVPPHVLRLFPKVKQ